MSSKRSPHRRRSVAAALAAVVLTPAAPAAGAGSKWQQTEIAMDLVVPPGASPEAGGRFLKAARAAAASWEAPCAGIRMRIEQAREPSRSAWRDGVNRIVMHRTAWCRGGRRYGPCYRRGELAITTTYESMDDRGRLVEADIELDGVHFDWLGMDPDKDEPPVALETVLAHEMGHVLGLRHLNGPAAGEPGAAEHHHSVLAAGDDAGVASGPTAMDLQMLCRLYPSSPVPPMAPEPSAGTDSNSQDPGRGPLGLLLTTGALAAAAMGTSGRILKKRRTRAAPPCPEE